MKNWIMMFVIFFVCMLNTNTAGAEVSAAILVNQRTDVLEARVEIPYDEDGPWTVGLSAIYFKDAEHPHSDFGLGLFGKLTVDPNATVPVSEWLPVVGDWLDLPESISIETYIIMKGEAYQVGDGEDIDVAFTLGAGGEAGPVIVEYVYNIIEGGDSGNPIMYSGPVVYLGLKPIRF